MLNNICEVILFMKMLINEKNFNILEKNIYKNRLDEISIDRRRYKMVMNGTTQQRDSLTRKNYIMKYKTLKF